ncbi:FMN-binding negative transcriptional regulator [Acinetobacter sp. MD2(2019)]|uniref:FMN-binding negative transcriptional regulator n=1 Tax=Acinetobacter sp. MD2(2019) TaxID=2605273 RepID=UPI002D1F1B8E|nr:FMN-binding negative transcriptional regulator [Acinetobacter sp. MD2(2019)]MEB3754015.1 FMN-binding negative transcriptional regulator [Acinetobacter sp. MD2(2019)]
MYQVKAFEEKNLKVLFDFMQQHRLAALVTQFDGELDANHIPFEIVQESNGLGQLHAHIAKANPLYQKILQQPHSDVLVIFQSDSNYISPNWYPEKILHHKVVPTWNYKAVHIKGKLSLIEDPKHLLELLQHLTNQEEAKLLQNTAWSLSDAPQDYINQMLNYIVGIQIEILDIDAKFKMSQNKSPETQQAVQKALNNRKHQD